MREFTSENIEKIKTKLEITKRHSYFYRNLYERTKSKRYFSKYEQLSTCLDFWIWDKYEQNKVLDLKKVNRCKDRFCPNCRSVSISQALVNFSPKFKEMTDRGYYPFMVTLTVPNVNGDDLEGTINKMNKAFRKFNQWFYSDDKGFKNRYFKISATIKALEVTVQKTNWNMYHPHFHCICFLDVSDWSVFDKYKQGPYSTKYGNYISYSDADIQIQKLWKFALENMRISEYNKYPDEFLFNEELGEYIYYQCDIRPLEMPKGVYEVFKYTFKDADIHTQQNFETLYFALYKKRLRQAHGELFGLDVECDGEINKDKEDINNYLEIKETPEEIYTRELTTLETEYHEYKKISRFKGSEYVDNIE